MTVTPATTGMVSRSLLRRYLAIVSEIPRKCFNDEGCIKIKF